MKIERTIEDLIDGIDASESTAVSPGDRAPSLGHHSVSAKALEPTRPNVPGRLGLEQVARSVGLSRPHFFTLFKEGRRTDAQRLLEHAAHGGSAAASARRTSRCTSASPAIWATTQGNFTRFFRDHARSVAPTSSTARRPGTAAASAFFRLIDRTSRRIDKRQPAGGVHCRHL